MKLKRVYRIFLLTILSTILVINSLAQERSGISRRAYQWYERGRQSFNLLNYSEAEKFLQKAIRIEKDFPEAWMLLADVYKETIKKEEALACYHQVIHISPDQFPEAFYFAGLLYFEMQQYAVALDYFTRFLGYHPEHAERIREAEHFIRSSEFSLWAIQHPTEFYPRNLGEQVNTPDDEFINAISTDELELWFTGRDAQASPTRFSDRFFYSRRQSPDTLWEKAVLAPPPLNTRPNQGALMLSHDGRYLFLAGCQWPEGFGSCDIYILEIAGNYLNDPVNAGNPPNSNAWDSQPSLAPDGRTLFFASTRQGGFGKSDIWKSYLQDDGTWSIPENLGPVINTYGDEMAPFIHADGKTLYFSSDRHPGLGGRDLFVSRLNDDGSWSKPVNLGFPVNTGNDEMNMVVTSRGLRAYISVKHDGGYGGYDIYEFDLDPSARPLPVTYVRGVVTDAIRGNPLEALCTLIDLETGREMVRTWSDSQNGSYLVCLPVNRSYAMHVAKEGYLFHSEHFSLSEAVTSVKPYQLDISLQPVLPGMTTILRNIFFPTGQWNLDERSMAELNTLVNFLEKNPDLVVEIGGHTDNVGTVAFNQHLSEQRARSVVNYLISKGISPDRLTWQGYGMSRPVASNDNEEGRTLNRRTEVKILGLKK